MRTADAEGVRALPLFQGMQDDHFDTLVAAGYLQRFPAHVVLLHEGERPDFLHILVEGAVELFATHRGRETTLSILQPPGAFILAAVVLDQVYLKSARTLRGSTVVMIPAEAVRSVFDRDQWFARATVRELAGRYRGIVRDLKNMRLRTSLERLAGWMLRENAATGGGGRFRIGIEKRSLASNLGMRPENLSRAFAELGEHGVVVKGREVTLRDVSALEQLAGLDPLIDGAD